MTFTFSKVDYTNGRQLKSLLELLQMYAQDPMGGETLIPAEVVKELPSALQKRPYVHSFMVNNSDNSALGFANCIESFSTFAAKPVLNIHDFAVIPSARKKGVSQFMLENISIFARSIGCCKLTLEVLEGNKAAISAYEASGFKAYELAPDMGKALFFQKYL